MVQRGGILPSEEKGEKEKEPPIMRIEIECLNYRCPTSVAVADFPTYYLSKLECRGDKRIGPGSNHGVYKSAAE